MDEGITILELKQRSDLFVFYKGPEVVVRLRGSITPVLERKGNEVKRLGVLIFFFENNLITAEFQSGEVILSLDNEVGIAMEGEEFFSQARFV